MTLKREIWDPDSFGYSAYLELQPKIGRGCAVFGSADPIWLRAQHVLRFKGLIGSRKKSVVRKSSV